MPPNDDRHSLSGMLHGCGVRPEDTINIPRETLDGLLRGAYHNAFRDIARADSASVGSGFNGGDGPQGEDGKEGEPSAKNWGDEPGGPPPLAPDEDEGPDPEMVAICDKIISACDRLDQRMTAMERARRLDAVDEGDCQ
jgi:hypothetical protein